MWDHGRGDDADGAPIVAVAPVRPRRTGPRTLLVAVLVGGLAFFAGMQVGAWGASAASPPRSDPSATPPASAPAIGDAEPSAPVPTASLGLAPTPVSTPVPDPPGSSAFVAGFDPAVLIAGVSSGPACVTTSGRALEVPRTRLDGPRMTFVRTWMARCPVPEAERQSFVLAVVDALVRAVPSDAYAFSTAARGSGEALLPYAEGPYVGTVTLSADDAGDGLGIAVVLEERLSR